MDTVGNGERAATAVFDQPLCQKELKDLAAPHASPARRGPLQRGRAPDRGEDPGSGLGHRDLLALPGGAVAQLDDAVG